MAARYTNVYLSQFDAMLKERNGWGREVQSGSREFVYSQEIRGIRGAVLMVYSSIHEATERGRGRGHDAIRVCVVKNGEGFIKSKRVHRTQNWRDNLWKRIKTTTEEAYKRERGRNG